FAAVAILTLALGIGANAAVFTVINSLILNPLPVSRIATLVALNSTQNKKAAQLGGLQPLSVPNFHDLRNRASSCSSLAAHSNPHSGDHDRSGRTPPGFPGARHRQLFRYPGTPPGSWTFLSSRRGRQARCGNGRGSWLLRMAEPLWRESAHRRTNR